MRQVDEAFTQLASSLGYLATDGLVSSPATATTGARRYLLDRALENVGADAVYFAADTPLIYFAKREAFDPHDIATLHRRVWNDGRVPLLFIVSPTEVRLYDGFALPTLDPLMVNDRRLVRRLDLTANVLEQLADFRRPQVESGETWRGNIGHFDTAARCDRTLLENLRRARAHFTADRKLPEAIVDQLLTRSILLFYLEHRGVLTSKYYERFKPGAAKLTDLLGEASTAYAIFDALAQKFNGDLLPVGADERRLIQDDDIRYLQCFFRGEDLASGQLPIWPLYDFSIIPIQLVSAIYESFLHEDSRESHGAYYTPPFLVELIMNEVLPWPTMNTSAIQSPRVLDPACGSGIFLVEAYRRIVEHWRTTHDYARPSVELLRKFLTECIFGVDIAGEAVRVAAFSLHIAMLEYLEPKTIWERVRFPKLSADGPGKSGNLYAADAFDPALFADVPRFDIVVGNPPWHRDNLQPSARQYCERLGRPIATELAHAFMWLAVERAKTGTAALLCPSKWLFNRERGDAEFRRAFLTHCHVDTVVNLSALRHDRLFEGAIAPATAVVFRPQRPEIPSESILYCTPKSERRGSSSIDLVIDAGELKWLPRRTAESDDDIWKVLFWASWRDYTLIKRLTDMGESLGTYLSRKRSEGWAEARGFQPFDRNRNRNLKRSQRVITDHALKELEFIEAKDIDHYVVDDNAFHSSFEGSEFLYTGPKEIYRGPHILIKEGQKDRRFCAAFTTKSCSFRDTVTGISAPSRYGSELKALTAYLNSSVASYFLFLTASTWGVERERVKKSEVYRLPAALLDDKRAVKTLAALLDRRSASVTATDKVKAERAIDDAVCAALGLTSFERILVRDLIDVTIPSFQSAQSRFDWTDGCLDAYVLAFQSAMATILSAGGHQIQAFTWRGDGPLAVVSFSISRLPLKKRASAAISADLVSVLGRLDKALLLEESASIYVRRRLKIYEGNFVHIVKPRHQRYWTQSAALQDADEVMAESISGARSATG